MNPISACAIGAIRIYQWTLRPFIGANCRFEPSCSEYAIGALRAHGPLKGTLLALWRILRCNPWSKGGVDHVPARKHPVWHQRLRGRRRPDTQPNAQGA